MIFIENDGQKIKQTNYFDSEAAANGMMYFSLNSGCIRMLLPDNRAPLIPDIKSGKEIVISRGPWIEKDRDDAFEIMFDDHSEAPYCIHVGTEQWDLVPNPHSTGNRWQFAVWTRERCILHKKCFYRKVKRIPWMKPW